jgi:hypothetical protein
MHSRRVGNGPRTFEELACCRHEHEPLRKGQQLVLLLPEDTYGRE